MTDENDEIESLRMNLFCTPKKDETFTVMVGPGWYPPLIRSFFDENDFESAPVVLDFEHLRYILEREGTACEIKESLDGGKELTAEGKSTLSLAKWLGGALASGMVKR